MKNVEFVNGVTFVRALVPICGHMFTDDIVIWSIRPVDLDQLNKWVDERVRCRVPPGVKPRIRIDTYIVFDTNSPNDYFKVHGDDTRPT